MGYNKKKLRRQINQKKATQQDVRKAKERRRMTLRVLEAIFKQLKEVS